MQIDRLGVSVGNVRNIPENKIIIHGSNYEPGKGLTNHEIISASDKFINIDSRTTVLDTTSDEFNLEAQRLETKAESARLILMSRYDTQLKHSQILAEMASRIKSLYRKMTADLEQPQDGPSRPPSKETVWQNTINDSLNEIDTVMDIIDHRKNNTTTLFPMLKNNNYWVQSFAADYIGQLDPPPIDAVPALVEIIQQQNPLPSSNTSATENDDSTESDENSWNYRSYREAKKSAFIAIGLSRDHQAVDFLMNAYEKEKDNRKIISLSVTAITGKSYTEVSKEWLQKNKK